MGGSTIDDLFQNAPKPAAYLTEDIRNYLEPAELNPVAARIQLKARALACKQWMIDFAEEMRERPDEVEFAYALAGFPDEERRMFHEAGVTTLKEALQWLNKPKSKEKLRDAVKNAQQSACPMAGTCDRRFLSGKTETRSSKGETSSSRSYSEAVPPNNHSKAKRPPPIGHHCGIKGHIRPHCRALKRLRQYYLVGMGKVFSICRRFSFFWQFFRLETHGG